MLTLHLVLSFLALAVGAVVLINLCSGGGRGSALAWALILSTALICVTGLALPSPAGTPTPDPARVLSVIELVVVALAALSIARGLRSLYGVTIVMAVYLNVFVTVAQAFLKLSSLHALAPTGKEPPFLIAQVVTLIVFIVIGVVVVKRIRHQSVA